MPQRVGHSQEDLTITTSAYVAGDSIGGLITFDTSEIGPTGRITRVVIADDDNEKAALKLWVFNESPTAIADADPFAPVFADLKLLMGVIAIAAGDYTTINGNAYAEVTGLTVDYQTDDNNLYCYLVPDGTPTYAAATDLTVTLTAVLM